MRLTDPKHPEWTFVAAPPCPLMATDGTHGLYCGDAARRLFVSDNNGEASTSRHQVIETLKKNPNARTVVLLMAHSASGYSKGVTLPAGVLRRLVYNDRSGLRKTPFLNEFTPAEYGPTVDWAQTPPPAQEDPDGS